MHAASWYQLDFARPPFFGEERLKQAVETENHKVSLFGNCKLASLPASSTPPSFQPKVVDPLEKAAEMIAADNGVKIAAFVGDNLPGQL